MRYLQKRFNRILFRIRNNIDRLILCNKRLPVNYSWRKYGTSPIYGDSDTKSVFDPFVLSIEDKLVMILSERKKDSIIQLESKDGIIWGNTHTLLTCIRNTWQHRVNRASLIFHNGVWHMWYTGQSPEISCIGHTTSANGFSFENAKKPCLQSESEDEGVSVMNPCVIWNCSKKLFQMWYAAGENYEPDSLFYAESKDGDYWEKYPRPILTKYSGNIWERAKVGGCDVKILDDGSYIMFYIGYQDLNTARICYALSQDGIKWVRPKNNLILGPTKGSWDADATYKPSYLKWKGKEMLWYNGRTGNCEYIGLAVKK